MGTEFMISDKYVRATATGKQDLRLAMDVSAYQGLDALLDIINIEGTASPGVIFKLQTSMSRDTESGWATLLTFDTLNSNLTNSKVSVTSGLLKYLRWELSSLGGATAVTFQISGMLRKCGCA